MCALLCLCILDSAPSSRQHIQYSRSSPAIMHFRKFVHIQWACMLSLSCLSSVVDIHPSLNVMIHLKNSAFGTRTAPPFQLNMHALCRSCHPSALLVQCPSHPNWKTAEFGNETATDPLVCSTFCSNWDYFSTIPPPYVGAPDPPRWCAYSSSHVYTCLPRYSPHACPGVRCRAMHANEHVCIITRLHYVLACFRQAKLTIPA